MVLAVYIRQMITLNFRRLFLWGQMHVIESVQFSYRGNQVTMFVFLDTDDSQVSSRLWSKQRRSHPRVNFKSKMWSLYAFAGFVDDASSLACMYPVATLIRL